MNVTSILSELRAERSRIDKAISALEGLSTDGVQGVRQNHGVGRTQKRGRMSAEGRRRISEMMKKRWAERRKKMTKKK